MTKEHFFLSLGFYAIGIFYAALKGAYSAGDITVILLCGLLSLTCAALVLVEICSNDKQIWRKAKINEQKITNTAKKRAAKLSTETKILILAAFYMIFSKTKS